MHIMHISIRNNSNYIRKMQQEEEECRLSKHIHGSLLQYDMDMNLNQKHTHEEEPPAVEEPPPPAPHKERAVEVSDVGDVLTVVSKMMMHFKTKTDLNELYIELPLLSKGANGKIFGIKLWKKHCRLLGNESPGYFMGLLEILRNWRLVETLELLDNENEIFEDAQRSTCLIVLHVFKGSICELLKETYLKKRRCLTENDRVATRAATLKTMHCNGTYMAISSQTKLQHNRMPNTNEMAICFVLILFCILILFFCFVYLSIYIYEFL
eukprot:12843_1